MRWQVVLVSILLFLITAFPILSQDIATNSEMVEQLNGLEFDEFIERSYHMLLRRDPELAIEVGLQNEVGLEAVTLTYVSDSYRDETDKLVIGIYELLQNYERDTLTSEQQLSYDIYAWYLADIIQGQQFRLNEFPVTFMVTAIQNTTRYFFTDIHPIESVQDAEDYVTRLGLVEDKFEQVVELIATRKEAGVIPPRFVIQWTLGDLERLSRGSVHEHDYYIAFEQKLTALEGISESQRQTLLADAEAAVKDSVMPGYKKLASTLSALERRAPENIGLWQYPNGDAYYDYLVRHYTTTDLTVDEIHELGLSELERIHAEMRLIFDELGYPSSQSIAQLYRRLERDVPTISSRNVVPTFEKLLEDVQNNITPVFNKIPDAEIIIVGGSVGGFYIPGTLDGSRPGAFYAQNSSQSYLTMPSLLYHEAVPGHHLQIAWAQELDLPSFRRSTNFTAYVEGWALYAERLAWDLGWYDDDPYGNLGRLQYEAFRAARLAVDTGIHAKKWTFDEAVAFFTENTGFGDDMAYNEIGRYVVYAGQANAYMIGMIKILEQRELAMQALGEDFVLADFHDVILDNGSMPLALLDGIVSHYIVNKQ